MKSDLDGSAKRSAEPSAQKREKIVPLEDWRAEAEKLFGADESKWSFRCPSCGHDQSMGEFAKYAPAAQVVGNCIGRFAPGIGCGFRITPLLAVLDGFTVVLCPDGDKMPVFEFSEAAGLGGGEAVAVPSSQSNSNPQEGL